MYLGLRTVAVIGPVHTIVELIVVALRGLLAHLRDSLIGGLDLDGGDISDLIVATVIREASIDSCIIPEQEPVTCKYYSLHVLSPDVANAGNSLRFRTEPGSLVCTSDHPDPILCYGEQGYVHID